VRLDRRAHYLGPPAVPVPGVVAEPGFPVHGEPAVERGRVVPVGDGQDVDGALRLYLAGAVVMAGPDGYGGA
jgi:hypothetical protein